MMYYDIELEDKTKNRRVSYMAENYMITDRKVLKIKSVDFGDVATIIEPHEHITITPIQITNEYERNM